jgi:hypothetical protein
MVWYATFVHRPNNALNSLKNLGFAKAVVVDVVTGLALDYLFKRF